ncbi:DUF4113 domain-containing protein [Sphingomonas sp. CFBP 8765]|nr:DUF4113 domain-containing protein [Sphingomonas sp. CFBP 8765]
MPPLGRLRRAHAVLVAKHADLMDRSIEPDGGDPFDGHEIFAAVEILDELAVIAGFSEYVRRRHRCAFTVAKFEVMHRHRLAADHTDTDKAVSRRLHPDAVAWIQQAKRAAIPCAAAGRDEAVASRLIPIAAVPVGAIDEINGRFGKFAAVPASQGFRREWRMRSEMKSPAWTTQISDVPTVSAR